jgi:hypothetical protein
LIGKALKPRAQQASNKLALPAPQQKHAFARTACHNILGEEKRAFAELQNAGIDIGKAFSRASQ